MNLANVHLHWRSSSNKGKKYVSYSLARSVVKDGSCRKEIILKLGKLSDSEVKFWKDRIRIAKAQAKVKRRRSSVSTEGLTTTPAESDTVTIEILAKDVEVLVSKKFPYEEADSIADIKAYEEAVRQAFADVPDPRSKDNLQYPFYGLLLIILASTLGGARSISSVYEYNREKAALLCPMLNLERPPSYSSFWWILARTNPEILNKAFIKWIEQAAETILENTNKAISIDGKTLRGAKNKLVHYVSAYECTKGILLGQVKTEEKSNEITAIPELLKIIDVKDAMVTIDAMGCQTKIASDIRERGGHYIIALKGNQGTLHAEAINFFEQARAAGHKAAKCKVYASEHEVGHGRVEKREIAITQDLKWLKCRDDWRDLTSLIEVKSTRTVGDKTTTEFRYYISSRKMNAKEANSNIRGHWGIENGLHWAMDVIFHDDEVKANTGYAAENLALFRRMAYCILKQETEGGRGRGLATQQRKAMWNERYVFELLQKFIKEISAGNEVYKQM